MVHSLKKGVILTARVHPGEPNASYMIRGAIEFLLSDCKEAKMLRKKIVFKVVPMLNPDGVIYGNYRCSLLGVDLNRRWKHPNAVMHPTIFYCKRMIQVFCEEREVVLFADFHGHSIKKEVFAYACCYKRCDVYRVKENLLIRLVPFLMSKENKFFSFEDSHFRVERSKMGTGRVVNFKENKILTSYTIEASFFGSSSTSSHFSIEDLEKVGRDLCSICSVFFSKREFTSKITELTNHIASSQQLKSDIRQSEKLNKNQNEIVKSSVVSEPIPEEQTESNFSIKDQLKQLSTLETIDFLIEEEEDSGGSESDASMNDDKRIMFILKNNKKHKNRPKHSQSPRRTSQVQQNSSFTHMKSSITPETFMKFRPKSRSSIKRSQKIPIKQIIPNKIIVNSPFIEDNHEANSIITKSTKSKDSTPLKPIRKLDDILRDLGLSETPLSYKSIKKKP